MPDNIVTDYTALLSGDYWNGIEKSDTPVFITYSFPTSAPASHADVGVDLETFQAFDAAQQTAARAALQQWADASGIVLLEVPAGQGQINFALYDLGPAVTGNGGFAFNPFGDWNYLTINNMGDNADYIDDTGGGVSDAAGDVFINTQALAEDGSIPLGLLLHEIGHALGLKHVNPNFEGDTSYITYSGLDTHDAMFGTGSPLDDTSHTVMSYNGAEPTTLGDLDIEAIQAIYGTNGEDGSQDASWSWNASTHVLTQVGFDGVDDTMRGVSVGDIMSGGSGDDRMFGLGGDDSLDGGAGNDFIVGGSGSDTMSGGAGFDTFVLTNFQSDADQHDVITDFTHGEDVVDLELFGGTDFVGPASYQTVQNWLLHTDGGGNAVLETIWNSHVQTVTFSNVSVLAEDDFYMPTFGSQSFSGTDGDDMLFGGTDADTLSGGGGADVVIGDDGDDDLDGNGGDDKLDGGRGDDTIDGGAGTDTAYYRGNRSEYEISGTPGNATITDSVAGRDGTDQLTNVEFAHFADGTFAVCFLAGTMIATPRGERRIEDLMPGDEILTASGAAKHVRFIGRQTIATRFADPLTSHPVVIEAGALAPSVPSADLRLSPGHAMYLDGMLVVAAALVNGTTVRRLSELPERFTYFHVELDTHELIIANGAVTETYCDHVPRDLFDNVELYRTLYSDEPTIAQLDLPTVKSRRQLPSSIRQRLAVRSASIAAAGRAVAAIA